MLCKTVELVCSLKIKWFHTEMESRNLRILNLCVASIPQNLGLISSSTSATPTWNVHFSSKSRLDEVHKPVVDIKVQESAVIIINEYTISGTDNFYNYYSHLVGDFIGSFDKINHFSKQATVKI